MTENEILNLLILSRAGGLTAGDKTALLMQTGSATAALESLTRTDGADYGGGSRAAGTLKNIDEARRKAETEIEFAVRNGLDIIPVTADRYPQRLRMCPDAPPVLFFKGGGDLNPLRSLSIVGTRRCTAYGQDMVRRLIKELASACPGLLVVSGLAYGIDIHAHRDALAEGLPTVAVLAHGLDRLYPPAHRTTATAMLERGGLLTENFTCTVPDRLHFLMRNRIVAGISDATVVIESAHHGGALVTARHARDYGRPVAACPGRADDEFSEGCNGLIRDGKAALITSAADLMSVLGWQDDARQAAVRRAGVERQLFPELTDEERGVVLRLEQEGDMQVNTLSAVLPMPVGKLTAVLFSLEMKGVVKPLAGGMYHLIK